MVENENIFNLKKFHKSTTEELQSVENRVRNLIGDKHWGEDGRYKEDVLRNMIKKFLPSKYTVGTGFIVSSYNDQIDCSTQIDILIFDSDYPVLFSEGDFYIVTPNSVKAVIEVKTDVSHQIKKTVKKINDIGSFLYNRQPESDSPFLGVFSYNGKYAIRNNEYDKNRLKSRLRKNLIIETENHWITNHLSLNKDIFVKYWEIEDRRFFSVYNLKDLSFSFFISNIITQVTDKNFQNGFPTDKEPGKMFDIELD